MYLGYGFGRPNPGVGVGSTPSSYMYSGSGGFQGGPARPHHIATYAGGPVTIPGTSGLPLYGVPGEAGRFPQVGGLRFGSGGGAEFGARDDFSRFGPSLGGGSFNPLDLTRPFRGADGLRGVQPGVGAEIPVRGLGGGAPPPGIDYGLGLGAAPGLGGATPLGADFARQGAGGLPREYGGADFGRQAPLRSDPYSRLGAAPLGADPSAQLPRRGEVPLARPAAAPGRYGSASGELPTSAPLGAGAGASRFGPLGGADRPFAYGGPPGGADRPGAYGAPSSGADRPYGSRGVGFNPRSASPPVRGSQRLYDPAETFLRQAHEAPVRSGAGFSSPQGGAAYRGTSPTVAPFRAGAAGGVGGSFPVGREWAPQPPPNSPQAYAGMGGGLPPKESAVRAGVYGAVPPQPLSPRDGPKGVGRSLERDDLIPSPGAVRVPPATAPQPSSPPPVQQWAPPKAGGSGAAPAPPPAADPPKAQPVVKPAAAPAPKPDTKKEDEKPAGAIYW
eukprot:Hpha_TRINITY_DN15201_c0_g2::TRINITY_DN15201_c0_g2_i1::g.66077::m.66077